MLDGLLKEKKQSTGGTLHKSFNNSDIGQIADIALALQKVQQSYRLTTLNPIPKSSN